jgi:hypothetical protein
MYRLGGSGNRQMGESINVKNGLFKGLRLVFFCYAGLLASMSLRAEPGRDFTGQYVISGVIADHHTVNAMLTVRIVNHASHAVLGARVWLGGTGIVVADNLSFADQGSQVIRIPVTVSTVEFHRWSPAPPLTIVYREADGSVSRRTIELIPTALIPVVQ